MKLTSLNVLVDGIKKKWKLSYSAMTLILGAAITLVFFMAAKLYYEQRYFVTTENRRSLVGGMQEAHEKFIDVRLRQRGLAVGDSHIAILAIDEDSIDLEGRWPWSRAKIAQLLDKTLEYGAQTIAIDMIFSEEDGNSALPILNRIKNSIVPDSALAKKNESSLVAGNPKCKF